MKLNRESVLEFLSASRERFRIEYGVMRIGVFGSLARGDATEASDIDILVDMAAPTFDRYMDLKFELEDTLGVSVDLVLSDSLKERLRPTIEREGIFA